MRHADGKTALESSGVANRLPVPPPAPALVLFGGALITATHTSVARRGLVNRIRSAVVLLDR